MQKVYVLIDIGGTAIKHGIATIDGTLQERGELPTEAQAHGGPGIVAKVKLPAPEAARLDELGLHVGSSVRVLSGAVNESILIAVGDSRIGVNFDVAQKIYVY